MLLRSAEEGRANDDDGPARADAASYHTRDFPACTHARTHASTRPDVRRGCALHAPLPEDFAWGRGGGSRRTDTQFAWIQRGQLLLWIPPSGVPAGRPVHRARPNRTQQEDTSYAACVGYGRLCCEISLNAGARSTGGGRSLRDWPVAL